MPGAAMGIIAVALLAQEISAWDTVTRGASIQKREGWKPVARATDGIEGDLVVTNGRLTVVARSGETRRLDVDLRR